VGTELSDATEEADWRKLVHRAWSARNRFPKEPNKSCRLGCGCNDESMLHMIECRQARPLWNAAIGFCNSILGDVYPPSVTHAIVFGMGAQRGQLMSEPSRAFLRHVVGTYYRDATRVHENGTAFIWQRTYHDSLCRFRDAILRRGYAMRKLHINRIYTNLVGEVSEADRMKYSPLATVSQTGHTALTSAFTQAIANAKAAADIAYQNNLGNAPQQHGRGHAPVQRGRGLQGRGVGVGGRTRRTTR
jgi:hypothetical protein